MDSDLLLTTSFLLALYGVDNVCVRFLLGVKCISAWSQMYFCLESNVFLLGVKSISAWSQKRFICTKSSEIMCFSYQFVLKTIKIKDFNHFLCYFFVEKFGGKDFYY